jgi:hypothetical protein
MAMLKRAIPICFLLAAACAWPVAARAQGEVIINGEPRASTAGWREAVVMIVTAHAGGMSGGNGFVFGDGTWVATAAHVVVDKSKKGKHQAVGLPTVYSHAFGDVAYASIAALDIEKDLAILRVPWPGHPSLRFATDEQIRALDMGFVAAWQPSIEYNNINAPCQVLRYAAYTEFIQPRKGKPTKIVFDVVESFGKGWSGGPLVTGGQQPAVLGIITGLVTLKQGRHTDECAWAPAAGVIKEVAQ